MQKKQDYSHVESAASCDNDKMHSKRHQKSWLFGICRSRACESCFVFFQIHKQNIKFKSLDFMRKNQDLAVALLEREGKKWQHSSEVMVLL